MSWEQLLDIQNQSRDDARREAGEPPIACPIDGTILDIRGDGVRNCPMGNFRWEGGIKPQPPRV